MTKTTPTKSFRKAESQLPHAHLVLVYLMVKDPVLPSGNRRFPETSRVELRGMDMSQKLDLFDLSANVTYIIIMFQ